MKGAKALLVIGVSSVLLLLIVVGSVFSPSLIEINNQIDLNISKTKLLDSLQSVTFWEDWIWEQQDPSLEIEYLIDEKGMVWKSNYEGKGGFKIVEIKGDSSISYELVTDNQKFIEHGRLVLEGGENETTLYLKTKVDFSTNIRARYMSYFNDYNQMFSNLQKSQLERLKILMK